VIKSFRGKESERVWNREYSKRIPRDIQERAMMKLQQLNAAGDLKVLSIPTSNQLEALKGDRKGEYSIRINRQWGICSGGVRDTLLTARSSIIIRLEQGYGSTKDQARSPGQDSPGGVHGASRPKCVCTG